MTESARQATLGARAFYFITYAFFYWTVYLYPNKLTGYWKNGEYFWFLGYFVMHGISTWYFLTTHRNPGFLEPDHVKRGSVASDSSDDEKCDLEEGNGSMIKADTDRLDSTTGALVK